MRHASQLCKGLAEAATRSLDRPYIPRHVPLPSSSYGATAQKPAPPAISKSSSSHWSNDHSAGPVGDVHSASSPEQAEATRRNVPSSPQQLDTAAKRLQGGAAESSSSNQRHPKARPRDNALALKRNDSQTPSQSRPGTAAADNKDGSVRLSARIRSRYAAGPDAFTSHSRPTRRDHRTPTNVLFKSTKSSEDSRVNYLMTAYPSLTQPQASLLVQTFRRIHAFRSHSASTLIAWYEDLVWTTDRQAQSSDLIESPQSLSLLLRHAYQRNDLKSILRIESRAARMPSSFYRDRLVTATGTVSPRELENIEVDGVSIWPEPNEDPRRLAYNLKVAFAARDGNWIKVDELLNQTNQRSPGPNNKGRLASRSGVALDAIGWAGLLRFGLGRVQSTDPQEVVNTAPDAVDRSITNTPSKSRQKRLKEAEQTDAKLAANSSSIDESLSDEQARELQQDKAQAEAKLSVTKRLLPHLLRSIKTSKEVTTETDPATASESATPAWLLQSVLIQLSERGETASTIRIVQLALSESTFSEQHAPLLGGSTKILNLALTACVRNYNVNLSETLRVFNALTGSKLGFTITGDAVLRQPASVNEYGEAKWQAVSSESKSLQSGGMGIGKRPVGKGGSRAGHNRIIPNEESLVLVLKKVRHPLFRAAWTRKLVDEFQHLFPEVKLSGRSFRLIIHQSVVPAPARTPVPIEQASSQLSSTTGHRARKQPPVAPKMSASRGPIIKIAILYRTLKDILTRFRPTFPPKESQLHLSTTNRMRFEHTLSRAKRIISAKREYHLEKVEKHGESEGDRFVKHHRAAAEELERLLKLIRNAQRMGRAEEQRRKSDEKKWQVHP